MAYRTDVATKPCVAMAFKDTSMDSHKDATACYELQIPEICHIQGNTAAFLLGFHLKNRVPLAKNGPVTATIVIKPECLAHCCEDLLYPCTSWFELHRSQESIVFLHLLSLSDSWGRVHYDSSHFEVNVLCL